MGGNRYEISFADIITEDICGGRRGGNRVGPID